METLISVEKLSKAFDGKMAVSDLNFTVESGTIFGFLGPSGSGKTTTIKLMTGQLLLDKGSVMLFGQHSERLQSADFAKMGIVGDYIGYYEKLTLLQNLMLFAKIHQVSLEEVHHLLKEVGLFEAMNLPAEKLSTGMKQRMLLVRALINRPQIVFLDEPTSGLDPLTSRKIHQLLLNLKASGTAIFLTTHDMMEATLLCDEVALLSHGHIVEQGAPQDLIQKYNQEKRVKVTYVNGMTETLAFEELKTTSRDFSRMVSIHSCEPTLEDIFIQVTGGSLHEQ